MTARIDSAAQLVEAFDNRRRDDPVPNALLAADTKLTLEHLRRLVGTEAQAHRTELVAYGTMLSRFPNRPAADLYLQLGRLVYDASPKLEACARSLGLDRDASPLWPSDRETYAFNSTVSWVAAQGSQAATGMSSYADMTGYYAGCAEVVDRVRSSGLKVPDEFVAYYDDQTPEELCRLALEVVQDGLDHGDDPDEALLAARLLDQSVGDFWRAAAAA
ncbi:hypothetical protein ACFW17_28545 [Streptomyces sp. NPDC058961]|uniref:hypothetical protein n=1 Tax=Streptomyces sp. NPDC058961 TaxID=3346680 RepID=UPI0036AC4BDF